MTSSHELARITPGELALVCAHYDIGRVTSASRLRAGSRNAPKVLLITTRGRFVLKRRAADLADPFHVALTHEIQLALPAMGVPTLPLVGTASENNSLLQLHGHVYEMTEFVRGAPFDRSPRHAHIAGAALARLHDALATRPTAFPVPQRSYHASGVTERQLGQLRGSPPSQSPPSESPSLSPAGPSAAAGRAAQRLYRDAAARAEPELRAGMPPPQPIHGDWHPGNLLFDPASETPAAVTDFDAVCMAPRVLDVATGSLQFSIQSGLTADHLADWPPSPDLDRLRAFLAGYHEMSQRPMTAAERRALPWLMIESLLAEAAAPIAATGSFGRFDGGDFLQMAAAKAEWLVRHAALVEDIATRPRPGPLS